jgi:hypothetical protein
MLSADTYTCCLSCQPTHLLLQVQPYRRSARHATSHPTQCCLQLLGWQQRRPCAATSSCHRLCCRCCSRCHRCSCCGHGGGRGLCGLFIGRAAGVHRGCPGAGWDLLRLGVIQPGQVAVRAVVEGAGAAGTAAGAGYVSVLVILFEGRNNMYGGSVITTTDDASK